MPVYSSFRSLCTASFTAPLTRNLPKMIGLRKGGSDSNIAQQDDPTGIKLFGLFELVRRIVLLLGAVFQAT